MNWKKLFKWAWWIFIIYVLIGAAFYFLQDRILFRPVRLKKNHAFQFPNPHEEIHLPVNGNETIHLVRFHAAVSNRRGIILYFHGNKKNIGWYARHMPFLTNRGYEVLMIDYPGFGKSQGKLNEQRLYDWALETYKLAHRSYPADSITIYGKSMGTGIAAWLATARDCKQVILETPYYDMPSVIQRYLPVYPVKWMLHYQLPTYQYLQNISVPVTIFHGTKDRMISYRNASRLKPYLKSNDEFITIEKGKHNNLNKFDLVQRKLDSLLGIE